MATNSRLHSAGLRRLASRRRREVFARGVNAGHGLLERLETRQAMAAADLLPTLAEMRSSVYQVIDATGLAFDNRQIASRDDVNVGSEVRLYRFTPRWNFEYIIDAAASRRSGMDPVLAVYDTDTGARLAVNDDISPTESASRLTMPLVAGHSYTLAVTSYDAAVTGAYRISVQALLADDARPNDDVPARGVATRIPLPTSRSRA